MISYASRKDSMISESIMLHYIIQNMIYRRVIECALTYGYNDTYVCIYQ